MRGLFISNISNVSARPLFLIFNVTVNYGGLLGGLLLRLLVFFFLGADEKCHLKARNTLKSWHEPTMFSVSVKREPLPSVSSGLRLRGRGVLLFEEARVSCSA